MENQTELWNQVFCQERRRYGPLRLVRQYVPFWWRRTLRFPYLVALDARDRVVGRHDPLVPPRWLNYTGFRGFREGGAAMLGLFRELGGLQPSHRVLDIGCGMGRMAVGLTTYLTAGSYEGIDIVPSGVRWCGKHITPSYPQFRFQCADIYNKEYHPKGSQSASDYRFPYHNQEFDFVFLLSVFTHMLPADVDHYVAEISRMLKPGGVCWTTYFLLNDEVRQAMKQGATAIQFNHERAGYCTSDPITPETAVAYEEADIRQLLKRHSLDLGAVHRGIWSGRKDERSYQDIVLAIKPTAAVH